MLPKLYDVQLKEINAILKGRAHVVGGALRSYFEGESARDIDIFMLTDDIELAEEIAYELRDKLADLATNDPMIPVEQMKGFVMTSSNVVTDIYYAWEFVNRGTIISIIKPSIAYGRELFGTPQHLISEIDLDVCQIALLEDDSILFGGDVLNTLEGIRKREVRIIHFRQTECERTVERVCKYEAKGYTFKKEDLDKLNDLVNKQKG